MPQSHAGIQGMTAGAHEGTAAWQAHHPPHVLQPRGGTPSAASRSEICLKYSWGKARVLADSSPELLGSSMEGQDAGGYGRRAQYASALQRKLGMRLPLVAAVAEVAGGWCP